MSLEGGVNFLPDHTPHTLTHSLQHTEGENEQLEKFRARYGKRQNFGGRYNYMGEKKSFFREKTKFWVEVGGNTKGHSETKESRERDRGEEKRFE